MINKLITRFATYYQPEPNTGCWLWTGGLFPNGYAQFRAGKYKVKAHKWIYEQLIGVVPKQLELDHKCRIRSCVNSQHLEVVTHQENVLRGEGIAAKNAQKLVCLNEHKFNKIYNGKRHCSVCDRLRYLERK